MVTYVPSLPNCEKWKLLISEIAKDRRSESRVGKFLREDSHLTDIKVVSPAAADIAVTKSKVRQYKKKTEGKVIHKSSSSGRVKKTKSGKGDKKKSLTQKGKLKKPKKSKQKDSGKKKKAKQKVKQKSKKAVKAKGKSTSAKTRNKR